MWRQDLHEFTTRHPVVVPLGIFALSLSVVLVSRVWPRSYEPDSPPPVSLATPPQLPVVLKSGGLLILRELLVLTFSIAVILWVIWSLYSFDSARGTHSLNGLILFCCCLLVLLLLLMRGGFNKLFRPTVITIDSVGVTYDCYKWTKNWRWDEIDHAEVRRVSAPKGGSFSYACLRLKDAPARKSLAVSLGFADDPAVVALPAILGSSSVGRESAQSVCDLLNSVLAARR